MMTSNKEMKPSVEENERKEIQDKENSTKRIIGRNYMSY